MHCFCLSCHALSTAFVVDPTALTIAIVTAALAAAISAIILLLLLLWWLCRSHIHRICVHRHCCC